MIKILLYWCFIFLMPACLANSGLSKLYNPISSLSTKLVTRYRSGQLPTQNYHTHDDSDDLIEEKPDYYSDPDTPISKTCRLCRQIGRDVVAGAIAGLASELVLYPLDTIKTRIQTLGMNNAMNGLTIKELYSGIKPGLLSSVPSSSSFFATYNVLKHVTQAIVKPSSPYSLALTHLLSAAGGNMVSSLIRTPFEIIKTKAQTSSPLTLMKDIKYPELVQGWKSLVMRDVLFDSIQLPVYELMRQSLYNNGLREGIATSGAGMVAGATASAITTPIDVIKTRIMASEKKDGKPMISTIADQITTLYAKEGLKGMFAGLLPRMLSLSIGGSIYFGVYDFVFHFLGGHHQ